MTYTVDKFGRLGTVTDMDFAVPMQRTMTRIGSFVAGLGALVTLWPAGQPVRYPHRSDSDALFKDGVRVGEDMQRVIDREDARLKATAE